MLRAVLLINDLLCEDAIALMRKDHIFDVHAVFNGDSVRLQVFHQRQNHAFILVIFCEAKRAEIGKTVNMMHIAAQIPLHFQGA